MAGLFASKKEGATVEFVHSHRRWLLVAGIVLGLPSLGYLIFSPYYGQSMFSYSLTGRLTASDYQMLPPLHQLLGRVSIVAFLVALMLVILVAAAAVRHNYRVK